ADEKTDDGGGDKKGGGINPQNGGCAETCNQRARERGTDEAGTALDDLIEGTGALERETCAGGEFRDDGAAGSGTGGVEQVGKKDEDEQDVEIETDGEVEQGDEGDDETTRQVGDDAHALET